MPSESAICASHLARARLSGTSKAVRRMRASRTSWFLDVLFAVWLILINILYYAQFEELAKAKLAAFLRACHF
jgi:hypothetical protein